MSDLERTSRSATSFLFIEVIFHLWGFADRRRWVEDDTPAIGTAIAVLTLDVDAFDCSITVRTVNSLALLYVFFIPRHDSLPPNNLP